MSVCDGKEEQALRLHLSEKNFKNVSLRTCFFLFTKFQKKKDLKVIQGHKHNPSMNYTGF